MVRSRTRPGPARHPVPLRHQWTRRPSHPARRPKRLHRILSHRRDQGQLVAKTDDQGRSVAYDYTPDGRLQARAWARGAATEYRYDPATAELTDIDYADATPDIDYQYDRLGRIRQIGDASGQRQLAYQDSQLVQESYLAGHAIDRAYDPLLRPASVSLNGPSGLLHQVGYAYDNPSGTETGRLAAVTSLGQEHRYAYHSDSSLVSAIAHQNGGSTTLTEHKEWDKLVYPVINNVT